MRPIFVGGCERSGTTLLAALLAGHRRVVAPPEAPFFLKGLATSRRAHGDELALLAKFIRDDWRFRLWGLPTTLPEELAATSVRPAEVMSGLARAYAEQAGEEGVDRWVDHTPMNMGYAPTLLSEFDVAPLVHIIRDPHAVVASVLPLDWGPASARTGARWWLARFVMGLAAEAAFPGRVVRVRYEDLVRDPRGSLERLCPLVGLTFEPTMVQAIRPKLPAYTRNQHALVGRPPDPTRIDAWRSTLSEREIATIEGELRDIPAMLGYESVTPAPATTNGNSVPEFLRGLLSGTLQRWRHRARIRHGLKNSAQPDH